MEGLSNTKWTNRITICSFIGREKIIGYSVGGVCQVKIEVCSRTAENIHMSIRKYRKNVADAYELGLSSCPEHQPFSDKGHRSVILTTMDFTSGGWKGGVAMTGLTSVSLKHRPHAGPRAIYCHLLVRFFREASKRTVRVTAAVCHLRKCSSGVMSTGRCAAAGSNIILR